MRKNKKQVRNRALMMKKHKNKIIIAAIAVAILAGAWFFGGNYVGKGEDVAIADTNVVTISPSDDPSPDVMSEESAPTDVPDSSDTQAATTSDDSALTETDAPTDSLDDVDAPHTLEISDTVLNSTPETTAPTQEINPDTGTDKFLTAPVPDGKPAPVEPQDATLGDGEFTITMSVRCDTILNNMNLLDKEKHELVPDDGVIFPATVVTVYEGESVFNVLQREMKRALIHMEFMNTPIYNSAYIEGINNLYEFDVGELSGWMYKVNDWFPNYGCSRYQLKAGDVVEWLYTCDLGRDVGEFWLASGGQLDE